MSAVGDRIREARVGAGMTQAELAKALGKSSPSLSMYENGHTDPDIETLKAIARLTSRPVQWLACEDGDLGEMGADIVLLPVPRAWVGPLRAVLEAGGVFPFPATENTRSGGNARSMTKVRTLEPKRRGPRPLPPENRLFTYSQPDGFLKLAG